MKDDNGLISPLSSKLKEKIKMLESEYKPIPPELKERYDTLITECRSNPIRENNILFWKCSVEIFRATGDTRSAELLESCIKQMESKNEPQDNL